MADLDPRVQEALNTIAQWLPMLNARTMYETVITPKQSRELHGAWKTIVDTLRAQRDYIDDYQDDLKAIYKEDCPDGAVHCTCVGPLRIEINRLLTELHPHVGMPTGNE